MHLSCEAHQKRLEGATAKKLILFCQCGYASSRVGLRRFALSHVFYLVQPSAYPTVRLRHSDRQAGRQADGQTDRQTDRQTDSLTDRQTDRQTDRRADR